MRTLALGDHTIHWLATDTLISDHDLILKLHPDELAYAESLKFPAKKREFLRTRYLFHHLTESPSPFLRQHPAPPVWPINLTGSLTHKRGSIGMAVLPKSRNIALGIDAETWGGVQAKLAHKILSKKEIAYFASLSYPYEDLLGIAFSFKESIYKALNPVTGYFYSFQDAHIHSIDFESKLIKASILKAEYQNIEGSFMRFEEAQDRTFVITAAHLHL